MSPQPIENLPDMTTLEFTHQLSNAESIELVRRICLERGAPFSANDVNQAFADMPGGSEAATDQERLQVAGKSAGIRFREVESSFGELGMAAFESPPIVVERHDPSQDDRAGYLLILRRLSRSRLVVFIDDREIVVNLKWLKQNAFCTPQGKFHWFLAQPMMAAEDASTVDAATGNQREALPPFRRLLRFMRPEAADIRQVVLFSIVVGILSLTTPLAVEALVNTIAFGRYLQPLIVLSLMVFVFLVFRAGLGILMTVVVEILQRRLFVRVVNDLSYRLTRVPLTFLKKHHGPELVNRFFDIVNVQKITAKLLLGSLMLVLQTVIGLTVLAFYHPFLLGYDVALLTTMVVMLFVLGRHAVTSATDESQLKYETAAWLQEIVRHPTTFKFNGGLGFALNRADELSAEYIRYRRDHFRILLRQVTFAMMMQAVAATVLLGLGGYLVIGGQMTLGQLVAAELIVTVILGSFAKVGRDLESFYDLMAAIDKLGKLFDLPIEPTSKLQLSAPTGGSSVSVVDLKAGAPETSPIRFDIEPGSSVAIMGRSGSGKTKLIESIAGLQTPSGGYVLINGVRADLIDSESLQARIALVNDVEIFRGTVDENIRMGRSEIDSQTIHQVLNELNLHRTITELEQGLKTQLSVTGFPLSTNQAVRLVLARALIARPGALLIDGLLDRLADADLQEILEQLDKCHGATTLVVATGRQAIADWARNKIEI